MKLVTRDSDVFYLHMLRDLLEANGIPAAVKGDDTARMISPFIMTEPGLWVYLDDQFDDAAALVLNPDHEVDNKIDVGEFYAATKEIENDPGHLGNALLNLGLGLAAILFLLFLLLSWLRG